MDVKRVFEGLTLVTIGGILLANTTGALPWGVWWNILSLWPLLLVGAGIDLIGKSADNTWLRTLSSLLVIGGLLYGALVMTAGSPFGWSWEPSGNRDTTSDRSVSFSHVEPSDSAVDSAKARLDLGAGELTVKSGSDLFAAKGASPFGAPDYTHAINGTSADFGLKWPSQTGFFPSSAKSFADVTLARNVKWDLDINVGAAEAKLDLSDIDVGVLDFDSGATDAEISLGDPSDETRATIKAGASSITIRVPRDAAVEVNSQSGLASVDVADGDLWERSGEIGNRTWRTDGFSSASQRIYVTCKVGAASVKIERY